MREERLRKALTLLTSIAVVMIITSASQARRSRKASPPSSSNNSGGGRSSGGSRSSSGGSSSSSSSSGSRSSSGSAARSSGSSSRGSSGRIYRRTTPPRGTTSTSPRRNYTSRSAQSGLSDPGLAGAAGRVSRQRGSISSAPPASDSTLRTGRVDRKHYSYSDLPYTRRSLYHYHRDYYPSHRVFYWVSWPDCCRPICYSWGPSYTFGSFWPYYHRRFIFISLGGYWPDYPYRRYYWYGCHPYRWYGYYPPGYVIAGDTYNYYYYNDPPVGEALEEAQREYEQVAPSEPAEESQTDRYFDQGVKAFEAGDYTAAAQKFHEAQNLAPNDIVLPFARVQSLFAAGEYHNAAEALREALAIASPDKEGVFYPRGLYTEEGVLLQQIEQLSRAAHLNPADSDLSLLLGYQLLGMDRLNEAAPHLQSAALDSDNNQAATLLINLLEKLRKPGNGDSGVKEQEPADPNPREAPLPSDGNAKARPTQKGDDLDMVALAMAADGWLSVE